MRWCETHRVEIDGECHGCQEAGETAALVAREFPFCLDEMYRTTLQLHRFGIRDANSLRRFARAAVANGGNPSTVVYETFRGTMLAERANLAEEVAKLRRDVMKQLDGPLT